MKQIDERMDADNITKDDIFSLVRLRIRNLQAFSELRAYNDTGSFRFLHPLIAGRSERALLASILEKDPQEFLRKHRNVLDSIRQRQMCIRDSFMAVSLFLTMVGMIAGISVLICCLL